MQTGADTQTHRHTDRQTHAHNHTSGRSGIHPAAGGQGCVILILFRSKAEPVEVGLQVTFALAPTRLQIWIDTHVLQRDMQSTSTNMYPLACARARAHAQACTLARSLARARAGKWTWRRGPRLGLILSAGCSSTSAVASRSFSSAMYTLRMSAIDLCTICDSHPVIQVDI